MSTLRGSVHFIVFLNIDGKTKMIFLCNDCYMKRISIPNYFVHKISVV